MMVLLGEVGSQAAIARRDGGTYETEAIRLRTMPERFS